MTTTVFVDNSTRTAAAWFQVMNDLAYNTFAASDGVAITAALARGALKTVCGLTGAAGTNTVTATATPTPAAYATGDSYVLIPAGANTGATTLNVSSLGAKNIFVNGAACVGGELVASVPALLVYDGTQFNLIGTLLKSGVLDISAGTLGQIKFPAAQNASANANTLDDYEEGTWTPSVGGTATYTTQAGSYTKVGDRVNVSCYLKINVIGTGNSSSISGLPFSVATVAGASANALAVSFYAGFSASVVMVMILPTGTTATIYGNGAAGTSNAAVGVLANSAEITFGGTYGV